MPEDGSKLWPVAALADEGRRFELQIPLRQLARVAPLLADPDGSVRGSVQLLREQGRVMADVALQAELQLRCQRCLGPVRTSLESGSRVAMVESETEAATLPPELETALAPEGRVRLADLIEEELLLALPAAPRHADGECPAAVAVAQEGAQQTVQRPFAALGELLASRPKE